MLVFLLNLKETNLRVTLIPAVLYQGAGKVDVEESQENIEKAKFEFPKMPNTHEEQDFMLQNCHCLSTSSPPGASTKFYCQSILARVGIEGLKQKCTCPPFQPKVK